MRRFRFLLTEFFFTSRKVLLSLLNRSLFTLSLVAVITIFIEYGFKSGPGLRLILHSIQFSAVFLFGLLQFLRVIIAKGKMTRVIDPALGLLAWIVVIGILGYGKELVDIIPWLTLTIQRTLIHLLIIFVFILELGDRLNNFRRLQINPALIFLLSFLFFILLGTGLLLLPNATTNGISVLDALFTSTSAVCVTGLTTVSTAASFTLLGKVILMSLIQVGGLGVMTFTSFFGYFFQGSSSLESRFFMRDFINEDNISKVFSTLIRVVLVTFGLELVGALFIWISVAEVPFDSGADRLFFSIFHAISAFCNAGFSTMEGGLAEPVVQYNYTLHFIIAILVILGGLGFPIMFNYLRLYSYRFVQWCRSVFLGKRPHHKPRIINLNTRIALNTTLILLVLGFVLFFILEYDRTLAGKDTWGKISTAFFGAVTPRTAGFNTVDMLEFSMATILLYFLLMWIGASPGSTGGGIKTTTFAVGFLTIFNIAKGRDRLEIYRRQIAADSMKKAFVVMFLSILLIGLATFLLAIFEAPKLSNGELRFEHLLFEAFSAYGTAGLTLGTTAKLTAASKIVVIFCMFMGRVGTLTIIVALIRKARTLSYTYPSENIMVG